MTGAHLVLAATVVLALIDWWSRVADRDGVEMWAKPLTTVGIIAIAALGGGSDWTVIALAFCLIGDIALLPQIDRFVVGLGAFLVAHLAFVVAFVAMGIERVTLVGAGLIAAGLLIATVGLAIVRGAAHHDSRLRRPVLAYLVVISVMAAVGWGTQRPLVILGASAFVVSDSILGWRQFVRPIRHGSLLVMISYHVAIGSLALSVW